MAAALLHPFEKVQGIEYLQKIFQGSQSLKARYIEVLTKIKNFQGGLECVYDDNNVKDL